MSALLQNYKINIGLSKPISRILSWTIIYLGRVLPPSAQCHLLFVPSKHIFYHTVLLRLGFTWSYSLLYAGELLPRLSTLTLNII